MAFSDLCHISNAFKTVENEPDQSERIMEENSMVRDLITKILDETGPAEGNGSFQPPEKTVTGPNNQYPKNDTRYIPPNNFNFQNAFNFPQNNGYNFNPPNGFGNGFVNYNENDVLLTGLETEPTNDVTPEQLNLLRLAAQEIGGAQFNTNTKYDDKFYNFFEHQRSSMPEQNMYQNNFRPNSLNLDMNVNSNFDQFNIQQQRFPNKFDNTFVKDQSQDEILNYLNNLNISLERRDEHPPNNMDFKMPMEVNGPNGYQNEDFNKMQDGKMFFNRYPPPKFNNENNFFVNDMQQMDRNHQNFDVNQMQAMNFKPNGYQQNNFMGRDVNMMQREGFQPNGNLDQRGFENVSRDSMQQAVIMRQNQEIARQMSIIMRNRPPPNQLNVDVSFLHENAPFNLGVPTLLGPSPVPPPVLPSPMLDLPLLAPFYTMRNMRGTATSSSILHSRLDSCYEQWRQLERERKRCEATLALAFPGRAVSSTNSIPVPRLPVCPTRADRLTHDMLREHTKVLTLMGKMETLRASVCVAQNKKSKDDPKITVLKRGQENVCDKDKEHTVDPATFDPSTWREDVKNLVEIAPHSEVEAAMLSWRSAVAGVQAARRRDLQQQGHNNRYSRGDPILALAEAVRALCVSARRARCAMWCDLTLTVALAPHPNQQNETPSTQATQKEKQETTQTTNVQSKQTKDESKEEKPTTETKADAKPENNNNNNNTNNKTTKVDSKQQEKNQQRRTQNYRKLNQGRNDYYQKNPRYDNRFMHNRHPYYLATGPIN